MSTRPRRTGSCARVCRDTHMVCVIGGVRTHLDTYLQIEERRWLIARRHHRLLVRGSEVREMPTRSCPYAVRPYAKSSTYSTAGRSCDRQHHLFRHGCTVACSMQAPLSHAIHNTYIAISRYMQAPREHLTKQDVCMQAPRSQLPVAPTERASHSTG